MPMTCTSNISNSSNRILPDLARYGEDSEDDSIKMMKWDIPLDIAQMIFEKAMEEAPIPVHLALVSRQVQSWVEPLIYCHLAFRNTRQLRLFYRTFRDRRFSPTKTTSFFEKHVKTLHILTGAYPRMEQVVAIGRVTKSLKAAAGWDNSWGRSLLGFLAADCSGMQGVRIVDAGNGRRFSIQEERGRWRDNAERRRRAGVEDSLLRGWVGQEEEEKEEHWQKNMPEKLLYGKESQKSDTFPYKDLRRLSISSQALRLFRINLTHRIFHDLTHLDIYYCPLFDWSSLTTMKSLTHIAIDLLTHVDLDFVEMKQFMEELIIFCQSLPRMKVIIFACVSWWDRDFDLFDDEDNLLAPLNVFSEGWNQSGPLISPYSDEYHLHYFTQLSLGMRDPRVVLGTVTDCLQRSHFMRDLLVDFVWPKNSFDWDFSIPAGRHRESWDVAEEIIEKRMKARLERRNKAGKTLLVDYSDEGGRLEGEFGFGEIVRERWSEAHSR